MTKVKILQAQNASGKLGKHTWSIVELARDSFSVFVDNRPLASLAGFEEGRDYALEIIRRIQADGDYFLYQKPKGFLPPSVHSRPVRRVGGKPSLLDRMDQVLALGSYDLKSKRTALAMGKN
jgi:hypothetical protein